MVNDAPKIEQTLVRLDNFLNSFIIFRPSDSKFIHPLIIDNFYYFYPGLEIEADLEH